MLSVSRVLLAPVALLMSVFSPNDGSRTISVHLSAGALKAGDYGAFEVCAMPKGVSASFSPNPVRATPNRNHIANDRTVLTVRVAGNVAPGKYHLIVIAFSYVYGPRKYPVPTGYDAVLSVGPQHELHLPSFNHWLWVFSPDPQFIAPPSTCSGMPQIETSEVPVRHGSNIFERQLDESLSSFDINRYGSVFSLPATLPATSAPYGGGSMVRPRRSAIVQVESKTTLQAIDPDRKS